MSFDPHAEPGYVLVKCDSCGRLAERINTDRYNKLLAVSGYSLDECSACLAKRRKKEAAEAVIEEAAEKKKAAEFRRWLKKHGMTEDKLRDILPDDFWQEDD